MSFVFTVLSYIFLMLFGLLTASLKFSSVHYHLNTWQ